MLNKPILRIALSLLFLPAMYSAAQDSKENKGFSASVETEVPTDTTRWLDFWVGTWEAAWDEGHGIEPYGTNSITKVLDGKVVLEQFQVEAGKMKGFKGTSISVYTPQHSVWHQAWADNQGGYFNFDGSTHAGKRIFSTKPGEVKGQVRIQRMVFHDIREDSFVWDWEETKDGGNTWNPLWKIYYTRLDTK